MTMKHRSTDVRTPEDCPRFGSCGAMLCPLAEDPEWLSDEEICKLDVFQDTTLIKTQKKVQKRNATGIFTKAMLDRRIVVKKGIKGIPADNVNPNAENRWIQNHKERKEISNEQIQRLKGQGYHSERSNPLESAGPVT